MSISSNSFSIKSSLLNNDMLIERRKNEKYAYFIGCISQLAWAFNSIQLKTYKTNFPKAFSNNSLVFWRSLPIWVLGYLFSYLKNIEITPHKAIKHKFWFFLRSFGNYVGVFLWINMMNYFRVSTCQCIAGCFPVGVLFLSIWLLHESFYYRYLFGIIFCIFGTTIIVLNEKKPELHKQNSNIFIGLILASLHFTFLVFSNFGQKILSKQNMNGDVQNYYLGMYNSLPALFFMIIENHYGLNNILYVIYAISNGLLFYIGNYYQSLALENISMSKFLPITYMNTVFIFILGYLLLNENVYITDIIGSLMIIGFQIYNVWVPVGVQPKTENNISSSDK